jgi:hypothetical protein
MKPFVVAMAICLAVPAFASPALKPPLDGVAFLVGHWTSEDGKVADTGETSKGSSTITVESDGWALLRRDHTDTFDARGARTGGFDQTMLVYVEGGALKADYVDGEGHAIHYAKADIVPGKSLTLTGAPLGGPTFRLTYELGAPGTLAVSFGMVPPDGKGAFHPIASGTLKKT